MQNLLKQEFERKSAGLTLIETMVAMAISSILILGSITMYTQAKSNYRTAENVARLQENLRFSTDIIADDLRLAGYWGLTPGAEKLDEATTGVTITCGGLNVTNWVMRVERGTESYENPADPDIACNLTNPRTNSDVLIVRRVSMAGTLDPSNADTNAGTAQLHSNPNGGQFFNSAVLPFNSQEITDYADQLNEVVFHAYYISNQSQYDASMPALRRLTLTRQQIEDREIIPGVENLQVQFGLDTDIGPDPDGVPNLYVDSDDARFELSQIVSVRLWTLVRSDGDETGQGYVDKKTYATPDDDFPLINPQANNDYPETVRRIAVTRTVALRNEKP